MSYVRLPGGPYKIPSWVNQTIGSNLSNTSTVDFSNEKIVYFGQIWWALGIPGSAKVITGVQFRFGTVVKSGGSSIKVSLQLMTTSTATPVRPDGTDLASAVILSSNTSYVSGGWINITFGSIYAITYGDRISVVVQYDSSTGRLGSDTFNLSSFLNASNYNQPETAAVLFFDQTSGWIDQNSMQTNVIFNFNDGTFGNFFLGVCWNNIFSGTQQNDDFPTDRGNRIVLPYNAKCSGIFFTLQPNVVTSEFSISLYNEASSIPLFSKNFNPLNFKALGPRMQVALLTTEIELIKNIGYLVMLNVLNPIPATVNYSLYTVADAAHMSVNELGVSCHAVTRNRPSTTFTNVLNNRYAAGLHISEIDIGGVAGLKANPLAGYIS